MRKIVLSILMLLNLFYVISAEAADRFALVQAAYRQFCPLVQHTLQSLKANDELYPYKGFLLQIRTLCMQGGLGLMQVDNFAGYSFINARDNRFMGIAAEGRGPILVSAEVLNQLEFAPPPLKPLNFVLQTLMHEYGNKVPGFEQRVKDEVARLFAARYYSYEVMVEGEGAKALVFSIPITQIDQDFVNTENNKAQPSYLLLLEDHGFYQDLTPIIEKKVMTYSPSLRSTWTESNRFALLMMTHVTTGLQQMITNQGPQIIEQMRQQLIEQARRQNIPDAELNKFSLKDVFGQFIEFIDIFAKIETEEIRLFELHRARIETDANGNIYLLLQASFALNRSKVDQLNEMQKSLGDDFKVDQEGGLGIKKIIQVPLVLKVRLGHQIPLRDRQVIGIDADLRPELSYQKVAKLGQISRSGGRVHSLKIKLDLDLPPEVVNLRIVTGADHILLPAQSITPIRSGQYIFEFEIPENLEKIKSALWAESVLVNQSTAYMLERSVQITEGSRAGQTQSSSTLVRPGILVRDLKDQVTVAEGFHPLMPLLLMNKGWYRFMTSHGQREGMEGSQWINLDDLELRFGLKSSHKIRQIRLQMSYDIVAGQPKPENLKESFSGQITVNGQTFKVWSDVEVADQEHYYQTIVFNPNDISSRDVNGLTVIRANKKLPLLLLPRPLPAGAGYGPPMVRPHKIEVLLDDAKMTTLSHTFPVLEGPSCDDIMSAMKFNFSAK